MTQRQAIVSVVFVVYTAGLLWIAWIAWRRTRNLSDYILGGRSLSSGVAALSAGASDMSGWLLLGLPGFAYAAGLESLWIAGGLLLGTWFNWLLVARRLRRYSVITNDSLTLPDFLERRFRDDRRWLRTVSAVFILLFFVFYTSSGLVAGGKLFHAVFDLSYHWAVVAGCAAILIYTVARGFLAVSWTDVLQGLLMAVVLALVPVIAVHGLGGWASSFEGVAHRNPELLNPFTHADGKSLGVIAALSLLGWGLGYFGQPHILARFKAIHSPEALPAARRIAMTWVVLSMVGAVLVGVVGVAFVAPPLAGADTEKVFIIMVNTLFHPVVAGVCLAAILAAIMSTADSQMLVAASALTEDLYRAFLRREAGHVELVWAGRIAVVLIAVVALALAWDPGRKVLDLVAYAWGGFGAAFGPVLLMSLYWRRMTRNGALAGMLVGGTVVVIWKHLSGGWFDLYELVPGFVLALIAIFVVSILDRPPPAEIGVEFDEASAKRGGA
ncbi:MAG: sodium/proline symporter PutP [Acidiferrobacteraceae bacterium]